MLYIEGPVMTIMLFTRLLLVLVYMVARFYCFPVHSVSNAVFVIINGGSLAK